jgi:DNA-binding NarL/FixJ family response regulator
MAGSNKFHKQNDDPTMSTFASDDSVLPSPLLIVEDEPLAQLRLRVVLASLGYTADALTFADSIASADALLNELPFAMVLVDVGLPDGNGVDLIRRIHARDPALPILVISTWNTERVIVDALQAGATGYVLKEREDDEISISIRSALRGGAPIDPFVAKRILELIAGTRMGLAPPATVTSTAAASSAGAAAPADLLSPRENEILELVSRGLTNREIAGVLSLSKFTVECHIRNVYKKLAVRSRTQAVFEARALGFIE